MTAQLPAERGFQPCQVECYSGMAYGERPQAVTIGGQRHRVARISFEWREPGLRCFQVVVDDGKELQVCYDQQGDAWWVKEVMP